MNGARTTPWEGLVHCMGTVLDMEAVEDIDEACWLTITVELSLCRCSPAQNQDPTEDLRRRGHCHRCTSGVTG